MQSCLVRCTLSVASAILVPSWLGLEPATPLAETLAGSLMGFQSPVVFVDATPNAPSNVAPRFARMVSRHVWVMWSALRPQISDSPCRTASMPAASISASKGIEFGLI